MTPARTMAAVALKAALVMSFYDGLADLSDEIETGDDAVDAQIALCIVRDLASRAAVSS